MTEICRSVFGHLPRIFEPRGIVIADDGLALARGKVPSAPLRGAVGEVPGQQESEFGRPAGRNRSLLAKSAYRAARCGLVQQCPILRKGIPKQHRRIPPTPARPTTPMRGLRPRARNHRKGKTTLHRVNAVQAGVGHQEAFQPVPSGIHSREDLRSTCHVNVAGALTGLSMENAIATFALEAPGCSRDSAGWQPAIPRRQDHAG